MILDAATEEFGRYGYVGASLAPVAARVGVSKQLVLSYFGARDGLYAAAWSAPARTSSSASSRCSPLAGRRCDWRRPRSPRSSPGSARPHDWNVINDRTAPSDGVADGRRAASASRSPVRQAAESACSPTHELLDDAGDLSVLTEIMISSVTAMVNRCLRHPEESGEVMTRRGQPIIAALAVSIASA